MGTSAQFGGARAAGPDEVTGMARAALVISLIALVIAILAYQEAGGTRALQERMQSLQGALDAAKRETADALARMERALRPSDGTESPKDKPKAEKKQ